jgi:hypothetical protein
MNATFPYRLALVVAVTAVSLFPDRWSRADDQTEHLDTAIAEQITRWIQQLDAASSRHATRLAGTCNRWENRLPRFGGSGCQRVAANSGCERWKSLDNTSRREMIPDKRAAEEALKEVASSAHDASARRAKEILEPKKQPPRVVIPNIAPAQIQIQVEAIAGGLGRRGVQRIQVRNGVRQIETDDGQRKIKIVEDPAKGIDVEITQKKDGKEITERFQAKTAEELAKKDPEIHKLYQQMQNVRGVQIQAVPGGILPGNPLQQRIPLQGQDARRRTGIQMMQASRKMLANSIQMLEQSKGEDDEARKVDETIQRLKALIQQIEEQEDKFGEN